MFSGFVKHSDRKSGISWLLFLSVALFDHVPDILHFLIQLGDHCSAPFQLLLDLSLIIDLLFVTETVIHACPEIHGDRTELHLHFHIFLSVCQKDRDLQNQMQAPVSILLWMLYVIFCPQKPDVILPCEKLRQLVNILLQRTDNTYARYVK